MKMNVYDLANDLAQGIKNQKNMSIIKWQEKRLK